MSRRAKEPQRQLQPERAQSPRLPQLHQRRLQPSRWTLTNQQSRRPARQQRMLRKGMQKQLQQMQSQML